MTFASTRTIVFLTIVWAVALFGIDYTKHPRPMAELFTPKHMGGELNGKPVIKLWMNHMCCTGCLADVSKALAHLPSIKVVETPLESQDMADMEMKVDKAKDYGHEVVLDIVDLKTVDFMAIDRALRDAGLVADRMVVSGPRHYRLNAEVKHICCGLCSTGLKEGLEITKGLKSQGHFKWLDSFDVDKQKKLVVAYARYDEAADVVELLSALNHIGFQPSSIFVVTEVEGTPAH